MGSTIDSDSGKIKLWDYAANKVVAELTGHKQLVHSLAFFIRWPSACLWKSRSGESGESVDIQSSGGKGQIANPTEVPATGTTRIEDQEPRLP